MLVRWAIPSVLLLLVPHVLGQVFYASAVSYCSDARAIDVSRFLIEYNVETADLTFNISAKSIAKALNATLNFQLTAYGIDAVPGTSIDLCSLFNGVLCPLPIYDFVGSATVPVPATISSGIKVPSIAYVIPDLEATAIMRLVDNSDGSEAACLKVSLSNGLTTRQTGAQWALGGVALLALLVGSGRRKERLLQIFTFFQFCATSGMLSIQYPLVLTSFTSNFSAYLGLIYIESFQLGINSLRKRTGGNLAGLGGSLVGGTNQQQLAMTMVKRQMMPAMNSAIAIPSVSPDMGAIPYGIPTYTTALVIAPANAFMTTFFTFLLLVALLLSVSLLLALPLYEVARRRNKTSRFAYEATSEEKSVVVSILTSYATRVLLISWFPITLLSFYQWTLQDSRLATFIAVVSFLATTGALAYVVLGRLLGSTSSQEAHQALNEESRPVVGSDASIPLVNPYKAERWWFFLPVLGAAFGRAIFIAFAQQSGWVQTIVLLLIEVTLFVAMVFFTPYLKRSSNGSNIALSILRVMVSAILIVFNPSITLNEITRVILGFVVLVIEGLAVITLFILVVMDAVSLLVSTFRSRSKRNSSVSTRVDMSEVRERVTSSRSSNETLQGTVNEKAERERKVASTSSGTRIQV